MSQENVVRYRVPPVRPSSRRTFIDTLSLRLPRLARVSRSALLRLPLDSRLRRELVARSIRDYSEALNRRDREVLLAAFDRDVELNLFGEVAGLDIEDRYRGHEGFMRYFATIDEAWESNPGEPREVIDFGDRYLILGDSRARGRGSGVEVDHATGTRVTWRRGMVVRVDFYWSQGEALEAAGLSE
jgi:ketosteroid isomerase-like protein